MRFGSKCKVRLLGAAVAWLAAPAALAQQASPPAQQAPTPTPAPPPSQRPAIITLPGAETFDLRPANQRPSQATPAPTPAPTVVAPPIAAPLPTTSQPTRAPAPRPSPAAARAPVARATPAPAASGAPEAAAPAPIMPTPAATTPAPVATAAPAPRPATAPFPWLWLAGGAVLALLAGAGFWMRRRRRVEDFEPVAEAPVAAPPPAPHPVAPPAGPPARVPPAPKPAQAAPVEPIGYELRALALEVTQQGVTLDYELLVGNLTADPADGLRVSLAMMSANPNQDALIESFHFAPPVQPVAQPFDLAARSGGRIPGSLFLGHDKVHVVEVGGRPMFVPLVMIDVRWRGGLSVRHHGAAFMVGTAGQGAKLGPIWLDRGPQRHERLAANRYFRKSAVQAAE